MLRQSRCAEPCRRRYGTPLEAAGRLYLFYGRLAQLNGQPQPPEHSAVAVGVVACKAGVVNAADDSTVWASGGYWPSVPAGIAPARISAPVAATVCAWETAETLSVGGGSPTAPTVWADSACWPAPCATSVGALRPAMPLTVWDASTVRVSPNRKRVTCTDVVDDPDIGVSSKVESGSSPSGDAQLVGRRCALIGLNSQRPRRYRIARAKPGAECQRLGIVVIVDQDGRADPRNTGDQRLAGADAQVPHQSGCRSRPVQAR